MKERYYKLILNEIVGGVSLDIYTLQDYTNKLIKDNLYCDITDITHDEDKGYVIFTYELFKDRIRGKVITETKQDKIWFDVPKMIGYIDTQIIKCNQLSRNYLKSAESLEVIKLNLVKR